MEAVTNFTHGLSDKEYYNENKYLGKFGYTQIVSPILLAYSQIIFDDSVIC